jgi:hypothetical protein
MSTPTVQSMQADGVLSERLLCAVGHMMSYMHLLEGEASPTHRADRADTVMVPGETVFFSAVEAIKSIPEQR